VAWGRSYCGDESGVLIVLDFRETAASGALAGIGVQASRTLRKNSIRERSRRTYIQCFKTNTSSDEFQRPLDTVVK
jgi:hypothetical protein